jgi:hypothetical protein
VEIVERAHGGQAAVVPPTAGGSVPLWAFTDLLELPAIVVPYANASNRQHSPDEHIRLDHLYQGVRTTARPRGVGSRPIGPSRLAPDP